MKKIIKKMKAIFALAFSACCLIGIAACSCNGGGEQSSLPPSTITTSPYLSEENIVLKIGESKKLTVGDGEASAWTTSNTQIATVENGVVSGVAEGIAFIRATVGTETLICVVNVTSLNNNHDILLSAETKTINVGDSIVISGTVLVEGEETEDVIAWNTSNPEVLSLEANGNNVMVSAKESGEAILTATVGASTAVCTVTVKSTYDTLGVFNGCADMASAKITQNAFTMGAEATLDDFWQNAPITLYETAYYDEYLNNTDEATDALVLFATLNADALMDMQTNTYYRYGFLVQAVQITDEAYVGYQDKTYVYYATQGNEEGAYGIFIEDMPQGYYKAWAFVEYISFNEFYLVRSKESVTVGELQCNAVAGVDDIRVKIADGSRWGYGNPVPGEMVEEQFVDENGRDITAKYAFDTANSNYAGDYKYYYSPKMQIDLRLTETMLEEYVKKGYSRFTFWVYYKTKTNIASAISYLDLDNFEGATNDDGDKEISPRITSAISAPTNNWVRVQYDAALLAKYYDVLFGWNSQYPLFRYASSEQGILYMSDITMEKTLTADLFDPNDLIAENYELSANYGVEFNAINGRSTSKAVKHSGERITDSAGVAISPDFSFSAPASNNALGYFSMGIFQKSDINKAILQEYVDKGYTWLSFYVMQEFSTTHEVFLRTLDLAAINAENSDGDEKTLGKSSFNYINPDNGNKAENMNDYMPSKNGYYTNRWIRVMYDLTELIEAYDVVWATGTSWPIVRIAGGRKVEDYTYYLSALSLLKDEDVLKDTQLSAHYGSNSNPVNGINAVTGAAYTGEAITDGNGLTIMPNTVYNGVASKTGKQSNVLLLRPTANALPKELMQTFIDKGKTKLVFYVYRTTDVPWDLMKYTLKTADLAAYYQENGELPSYNNWTNIKTYMPSETIKAGCNQWIKYEYSLEDMITLYDVLWKSPSQSSWTLARFGCWDTQGGPIYISAFTLE